MEFDSIIACGDSFTHYHKTDIEKSWPALLGKHYNVPWVNLGQGGASNFQIALQPLINFDGRQGYVTDQQHKMSADPEKFKNPLILFGLTTPYRLPVFGPADGQLVSISSILPENLQNVTYTGVNEKIYESTINKGLVDGWFRQLDYSVTEQMYNWKYLIKGSNILWGTIHFQWDNPGTVLNPTVLKGIDVESTRLELIHSHIEAKCGKSYCFNEFIGSGFLPLQCVLTDQADDMHINWNDNSNLEFNPIDRHPTNAGIQLFADELIRYIDSI